MNQIEFHEIKAVTKLDACLQQEFDLSPEQSQLLLDLGAIYVDRQRTQKNIELREGQILRVHLNPKRFPVENINWSQRIIFENDHFLAVDKPAQIPSVPSLDNCVECVLTQMKNLREELRPTTRLDVPTSGILILSKTAEFQTQFNRMSQNGEVLKIYQVETTRPVPTGRHCHYMQVSDRAPKKVFSEPAEDRKTCELIVHRCDLIADRYCSKVELMTGRTHQIRVQLQFLGASVINDKMYGGQRVDDSDWIGLKCQELRFNYQGCDHHIALES